MSMKKNSVGFLGADWTLKKVLINADIQFRTMNLLIEPDYNFIDIEPEGDIIKMEFYKSKTRNYL